MAIAGRTVPATGKRQRTRATSPKVTTRALSPQQWPRGTEPDIDIEAMLDEIDDGLPVDLVRDVLWCYSNMNRRVGPEDAPSGGTWGLLCWSRKYQIKFYEVLLPKALANRPAVDEENQRQEKKSIADIRTVLTKFKDKGEEELRRNCWPTLRQRSGRGSGADC